MVFFFFLQKLKSRNQTRSTLTPLPINLWLLTGVQPITDELSPPLIRPLTSFDFGSSKPRVPSIMDEFKLLNRVFSQIYRLESTLYIFSGFLEEKLHPKSSPKP
jgi:hypothetical protein